jgi:hypothetical protein
MSASAVTLSDVSRSLYFDSLRCKIIEMELSRFLCGVSWLSLVSGVCIHVGDGSFAEAVEIDGRAPKSASLKVSFLYIGEFAQNFFPGSSFECFCDIFWSVGSCINGDVYMVLVESNLSEDPSMLFTHFSKNFFTTSLDIRKVKDVVTVFGLEA